MGNCLVMGERVIRVMKPDGKILEYRSPIRALDLLSEFSGHAVSETSGSAQTSHLQPEAKLQGGNMYYLVPLPLKQHVKKKKKKVRFSEPEKELVEEEKSSKVVRIKLIISKQELQELLKKGGVSVGDLVSQLHQTEKRVDQNTNTSSDHGLITSCDDHDGHGEGYWKPVLESIPEVN